jgi:hypothetical protein
MSSNRPPGGSPAYYGKIARAAERTTLEDATDSLHALWMEYGWRSIIDVMTEWVCAIEFIIPPVPPFRDFTGTVQTTSWDRNELMMDEAHMLRHAVRTANAMSESHGTQYSQEFAMASQITTRLMENVRLWRPVVDTALRAAHMHRDREPVRAALIQGPGILQRDWWPLRDGSAHLYQVASWPMTAARKMGVPVRPPEGKWDGRALHLSTSMALTITPEGELNRDC